MLRENEGRVSGRGAGAMFPVNLEVLEILFSRFPVEQPTLLLGEGPMRLCWMLRWHSHAQ